MQTLKLIVLALAAAVALWNPARASEPPHWITITKCDSVVVDGAVLPRVTFDINNLDPKGVYVICLAFLVPRIPAGTADTCRAVQSGAPSGWNTGVESSNGHVVWIHNDEHSRCILPGTTLGGFQVVLTKAQQCCYDIYFEGNDFFVFAQDVLCVKCDSPVPTLPSSWGRLKAIYRS